MCRADTFQSETNWSRYIRWLGIRKHENRITKSIPPFSIKRSAHFGLRLYKHLYTSLGENSHLLYWFREIYIVTLHLQHRKYITQALLFHALQQKKDDTIVIIIKGLYHITSSHTQPCKKNYWSHTFNNRWRILSTSIFNFFSLIDHTLLWLFFYQTLFFFLHLTFFGGRGLPLISFAETSNISIWAWQDVVYLPIYRQQHFEKAWVYVMRKG